MKFKGYHVNLLNCFAKSRGCSLYVRHFNMGKCVIVVDSPESIDGLVCSCCVPYSKADCAAKDILDRIRLSCTEKTFNENSPGLHAHFQHIPKFNSLKELELQLVLAGFYDDSSDEVDLEFK